MPASTALSPHAPLQQLGAAHVRWVSGFWGDITARTREVTVPGMWESLSDPAISPGLRNFRLAAGLEEGEHTGPPFMDGDLYKWLEAAIAELEIAPDPALAETVESVAALIASVQRDDGYVHTPTLIAARHHENALALADRFHFETYNLGHLITAGVRHYEVTGSTTSAGRGARRSTVPREPRDERAGRARSQRDLPIALHGRDRPLPRDARRAVPAPRRGVRARARRLRRAATTIRTGCPCASRRSSPATRCARTTCTRGSPTSSPRPATPNCRAVLEHLWSDVVDTKLYVTGGCGAPVRRRVARRRPVAGGDQPHPPGLRSRLPAAAHHRARRVVREHRHDPVERADAGAHRRCALRRRDRADRVQRAAGEHQPGRHPLLLHERAAPGPRPAVSAARCPATPVSTRCPLPRRRMRVCASPTSAASAARRTSRARSPGSTSVRRR